MVKAQALARPQDVATRVRSLAQAVAFAQVSKVAKCHFTVVLPKRGFNNTRFQDKIAVVNVASLNERFEDGDTVNMGTLKAARLVKGTYDGVKVLG